MEQLLEYFGVITGFLYLLLEIRQHKAMWVVGFLTSLVYVFVFFFSKIYADMGLNIYYVAISIYGFKKWTCTKKSVTEEKVSDDLIFYRHITWPLLAGIASAILAIYVLLYYVLHNFTDSPIPMGDAFTTSVGIVATWMLARRIIEHWIFWANRQFRIRLSLLPPWPLSNHVFVHLLRNIGHRRIFHLEKERNK